jgi:tryptophanyl-tRNA synthetase
MSTSAKKRIFSGIQPSGEIHVGNYVGAIRNWVRLQADYECIYCIVDYHAITQPYEPADMQPRIFNAAVALLGAGIDPATTILFVQSQVPEHTELAWVLNSVTSIGALERMTQFKEKSTQHRGSQNVGLLDYPVLQTADILLYKGELVPVGDDQVQHLELAREIGRRFNYLYGDVFPEPQALLTSTPRIMGVDGKTKMSKSLGNTLPVLEAPEVLWEKLRTAVTDENRKRRSDPGEPDICNIFTMHKALSAPEEIEQVATECRRAGIGCVDCKKMLFENLKREIVPYQARARELTAHPEQVWEILDAGTRRASAIAVPVMEETRAAMGMRRDAPPPPRRATADPAAAPEEQV